MSEIKYKVCNICGVVIDKDIKHPEKVDPLADYKKAEEAAGYTDRSIHSYEIFGRMVYARGEIPVNNTPSKPFSINVDDVCPTCQYVFDQMCESFVQTRRDQMKAQQKSMQKSGLKFFK